MYDKTKNGNKTIKKIKAINEGLSTQKIHLKNGTIVDEENLKNY